MVSVKRLSGKGGNFMKKDIILPSLGNLKNGIDELLLKENWDDYKYRSSPKKFMKRLNELFITRLGIFPTVVQLSNSDRFPFRFYRLRKRIKSMNPHLISEYSYPPNHRNVSHQRANIPYHPVFYCSDYPITAIYETVLNDKNFDPNAEYYLSQWELRENVNLKISPFLYGNISEKSMYKRYSDLSTSRVKEILKGYSDEEQKGYLKVLDFLNKMFIYENTYIVSSYIAHSYIYAGHSYRCDLFMYPSVQSRYKAVNIAIHPNVVAEKLVLKNVYKVKINNLNQANDSGQITIQKLGENIDGIIYWSDFNPDTDKGKLFIKDLGAFSSSG
jgi:hypothetical protein